MTKLLPPPEITIEVDAFINQAQYEFICKRCGFVHRALFVRKKSYDKLHGMVVACYECKQLLKLTIVKGYGK